MFRIIPRQTVSHLKEQFKIIIKEKISIGKFEKKLADYLNIKNVVAVGSATLAFYLILKNIKKTDKDEVIISGYNYYDLINVINYCGMNPIFVSIDENLQMNINEIKSKITKNTRAILITHLFGFHSDVKSILSMAKNKGIYVIEDCTHALGSSIDNKKVGSFGDFGIFSFNKWKIMDCFGGGVISSNNTKIISKIKDEVSNYKSPSKISILNKVLSEYILWTLTSRLIFSLIIFPIVYFFNLFNYDLLFELTKDRLSDKFSNDKKIKFTELQATIGLSKMLSLDSLNKNRKKNYKLLLSKIKNKSIILINPSKNENPIIFPVIIENKKIVYNNLINKGIDTINKYYGYSLDKLNYIENNLLLLPIHNKISSKDISYMAKVLNKEL